MSTTGTGPDRRGEAMRLLPVLLAGLVSAVALTWAALAVAEGQDDVVETVLHRRAAQVADAVEAEWNRWRRAPGALDIPGRRGFLLDVGDDFPAHPTPRALEPGPERAPAHDALMDESLRLEVVAGDEVEALTAALDASRLDAGATRGVRARMRVLQLAARLGRSEVVTATWDELASALRGDELLDGRPVLVRAGLVAATSMAPDHGPVVATLVECLEAGWLLLTVRPAAWVVDAGGPRMEQDALARALHRRLLELSAGLDSDVAKALGGALDAHRARVLDDLVRRTVAGWPEPSTAAWRLLPPTNPGLFEEPFLLAHRLTSDGRRRLGWVPRRVVLAGFAGHLEASRTLSGGFVLDLGGGGDGEVVRPPAPLAASSLEYVLRHPDPASLPRAAGERLFRVQAALGACAVFCLGAALLAARAQRRTARLARLRSAFVASVSHELRTPVASLLLLAENLVEGRVVEASARARYHALILDEAERLRRLVHDALDVARLERGEGPRLRRQAMDASEVVAGLGGAAEAAAARFEVPLRVTVGEVEGALEVDEEALRRAVLNLVENGCVHGGGEEVEVVMATSGRELVVTVRDRGPGVPRRLREAIFRPFERGGAGPEVAGTGLGLAIVRSIARAHGGEVGVSDGSDGGGAVFTLRVPLVTAAAALGEVAS